MWDPKPEWGLLSLRGCGGSRAPKSQPMKLEEGRLSATIVSRAPKVADNQNGSHIM